MSKLGLIVAWALGVQHRILNYSIMPWKLISYLNATRVSQRVQCIQLATIKTTLTFHFVMLHLLTIIIIFMNLVLTFQLIGIWILDVTITSCKAVFAVSAPHVFLHEMRKASLNCNELLASTTPDQISFVWFQRECMF